MTHFFNNKGLWAIGLF